MVATRDELSQLQDKLRNGKPDARSLAPCGTHHSWSLGSTWFNHVDQLNYDASALKNISANCCKNVSHCFGLICHDLTCVDIGQMSTDKIKQASHAIDSTPLAKDAYAGMSSPNQNRNRLS